MSSDEASAKACLDPHFNGPSPTHCRETFPDTGPPHPQPNSLVRGDGRKDFDIPDEWSESLLKSSNYNRNSNSNNSNNHYHNDLMSSSPDMTPRPMRSTFVSSRMESRYFRQRCIAALTLLIFGAGVTVAAALIFAPDDPKNSDTLSPTYESVAFVFRDSGEALALFPVFTHLRDHPLPDRRNRSRNISVFAIITGYGSAPTSLLKHSGVFRLSQLGVDDSSLASGLRNETLPDQAVMELFRRNLSNSLVVTGMVSAVQMQIARLAHNYTDQMNNDNHDNKDNKSVGKIYDNDGYNRAKASRCGSGEKFVTNPVKHEIATSSVSPYMDQEIVRVVAYLDGFRTSWNPSGYAAKAVAQRTPLAEEVLTTSKAISSLYLHHVAEKGPKLAIFTTGSPTLEIWREKVLGREEEIRRIRTNRYHVDAKVPIVHFFGGYDESSTSARTSYLESVRVFAKAVRIATQSRNTSDIFFIASMSPKLGRDTKEEEQVFEQEGVRVIVVKDTDPPLLAKAANITVSHISTCGVHSLAIGIPHIYVSAEGGNWHDIATDLSFAKIISDPTSFTKEFLRIKRLNFVFNQTRLEKQTPIVESKAIILKHISDLVSHSQ